MIDEIQSWIDQRQREISVKLEELHRKQEGLFLNKIRLLERKDRLSRQLEELRARGFLK